MAYCVGNGIWDGVFAVPNEVADAHLKMASGLSVKVLLLLLRHGGRLESRQMADLLGQTTADIQDAVHYWVAHGVLSVDNFAATDSPAANRAAPAQTAAPTPAAVIAAAPTPAEAAKAAAAAFGVPSVATGVQQLTSTLAYQELPVEAAAVTPPADSEPVRKVTTMSSSRVRLTTQEINEMARQDKNIAYLLQETQAVLGKPLTPVSTDTVVALYTYHGIQPDLILMLIHYCVSLGKDNMRYIEKVATDWMEKGIDTHEKAEAEIVRLTQKNSLEGKVKTAFGIYDRSLVPSEKAYIHTWLSDYRQDMALIQLAYERSVEIKGKLSFPYINGILSNWHGKGVTTPAQALQEIRENKGKPQSKEQPGSSYDIGELEKMITYGDIV